MCQNIFAVGDWNLALEQQFLELNNNKTAYIASPLGAPTKFELVENMHHAREYMFYAYKVLSVQARAPHAYMPLILNDFIPEERELGMKWGVELLKQSDVIMICGSKISNGMRHEIKIADELGKKIVCFHPYTYYEVLSTVENKGGVVFDTKHPAMAAVSPKEYLSK